MMASNHRWTLLLCIEERAMAFPSISDLERNNYRDEHPEIETSAQCGILMENGVS